MAKWMDGLMDEWVDRYAIYLCILVFMHLFILECNSRESIFIIFMDAEWWVRHFIILHDGCICDLNFSEEQIIYFVLLGGEFFQIDIIVQIVDTIIRIQNVFWAP